MELEPISTIKLRLGINPGGKVQKFFTDTCAKHMDKYVPRDSQTLRDTVIKEGQVTSNVGVDRITYAQPYAHAQYIGFTKGPVRNYTEPRNGTILG